MNSIAITTLNRRAFLRGTTAAAGATALSVLMSPAASAFAQGNAEDDTSKYPTSDDVDILVAAEIAEALAVTTYSNIIDKSPFFKRLASDDQGYLTAARHEEMSHYNLEKAVTSKESPFSWFYYPMGMFDNAQVTLNTLVTLEDAFIAAYLVGVRRFSNSNLRVTSARIMGIESDHRTLARVLAPNVAVMDGGPIEWITGIQGAPESVDPPNNNGYERTLGLTNIGQAVNALLPFVDKNKAMAAGFDVSRAFKFEPFMPKLPNPLGEFIAF